MSLWDGAASVVHPLTSSPKPLGWYQPILVGSISRGFRFVKIRGLFQG